MTEQERSQTGIAKLTCAASRKKLKTCGRYHPAQQRGFPSSQIFFKEGRLERTSSST